MDVAGLLHDAGASVQVVARKSVIHFHNPPRKGPRPLMERLRAPMTGLGPGWRSLFCTSAPLVFHRMPETFRLEVVRKHLGPAPGWFIKDKVVGHVELNVGCNLKKAHVEDGRVHLQLTNGDTKERTLITDHVIAGTGYKVDLGRLAFMRPEFRTGIDSVEQSPRLSSNFESSIPGLYFVGAAAANSFGPLLRFAYGASFTAKRLTKHLAGVY